MRKIDRNNDNLYDLEVEAGGFAPPLLISVVRNTDPNDDTYLFKIDQRGGLYSPSGNCTKIVERTWDALNTTGVEYKVVPEPFVAKLGVCEGDCDRNRDCDEDEGLLCFKGEGDVPGCYGLKIVARNTVMYPRESLNLRRPIQHLRCRH